MEQSEDGRIASGDAAVYSIVVTVIRDDWIAEWYAEQVREFARLQDVVLVGLSESVALRLLLEVAGAMDRVGYGVEWCELDPLRQSFTLNRGGVLVAVSAGE